MEIDGTMHGKRQYHAWKATVPCMESDGTMHGK